jgi:hypothetical protein
VAAVVTTIEEVAIKEAVIGSAAEVEEVAMAAETTTTEMTEVAVVTETTVTKAATTTSIAIMTAAVVDMVGLEDPEEVSSRSTSSKEEAARMMMKGRVSSLVLSTERKVPNSHHCPCRRRCPLLKLLQRERNSSMITLVMKSHSKRIVTRGSKGTLSQIGIEVWVAVEVEEEGFSSKEEAVDREDRETIRIPQCMLEI